MGSDSLLPPIEDPSELQIATVRCSHTTGVLRCIHGAARSMNEDISDAAGRISMARICERQPSFKEPLERGLLYTVISSLLVTKCPDLMKLMAESGNADHGTARVATTVQRAKKVWNVARAQPSLETASDWATVERIAALGMPSEFERELPC